MHVCLLRFALTSNHRLVAATARRHREVEPPKKGQFGESFFSDLRKYEVNEVNHPPRTEPVKQMGVFKNFGTPKSSILIGFSIIFTIHFGGKSPYFWKHPNLFWCQGARSISTTASLDKAAGKIQLKWLSTSPSPALLLQGIWICSIFIGYFKGDDLNVKVKATIYIRKLCTYCLSTQYSLESLSNLSDLGSVRKFAN